MTLPTAADNSCATKEHTPALPTLYFANDNEPSKAAIVVEEIEAEQTPSLQTLPAELLHNCLTKYADWGDLAKLACVQSKWKNIVNDAAEFGGRDAMWELSMCLLHGDDEHTGTTIDEAEEEEEGNNEHTKNNRGLQKNEALAVNYLTRLSGVEVDEEQIAPVPSIGESTTNSSQEGQQQQQQEIKSALPSDWPTSKQDAEVAADEPALLQLATCYLNGTGISTGPNPAHALHYLQTAYHLTQSATSAHKLALIYEYPSQSKNLVPIDVYAAFEWFKAAADDGHIPSMAEIALAYELGCGVAQSDEDALDWYTKAANAGHSASHYSVGEHFEEAKGVPMDHEEACTWYHRAHCLGEEDGTAGLRRLSEHARRVMPEAEADGILSNA